MGEIAIVSSRESLVSTVSGSIRWVCVTKHVRCVYNNSPFVLTYSVATYSSEDVFFGKVPVELHTKQRLAMFFLRRYMSHV